MPYPNYTREELQNFQGTSLADGLKISDDDDKKAKAKKKANTLKAYLAGNNTAAFDAQKAENVEDYY